MVELVVARYKENIEWLNQIQLDINHIYIYNKFFDTNHSLPNLGREGHTYLHHIIKNYDNLADYTIFCQGDPVFHQKDFIQQVNSFIKTPSASILYLGPLLQESTLSISAPPHVLGLPIYYFLNLLFGIKSNKNTKIRFYAGAQFIVHKSTITNRPKEFYQFLIKFLSYEIDPIEGYIIERLWPYIFDNTIPLTDKYKLFI